MTEQITILVAEDDPGDVFLLERAFRVAQVRARVDTVRDGLETVNYLQNRNPAAGANQLSLVLLDLKMPHMDGFEVLDWLASHLECRPRVVVVFSSSNRVEDMERAAELGADHYLVKPSKSEDLLRIVKRLEHYCLASVEANPF